MQKIKYSKVCKPNRLYFDRGYQICRSFWPNINKKRQTEDSVKCKQTDNTSLRKWRFWSTRSKMKVSWFVNDSLMKFERRGKKMIKYCTVTFWVCSYHIVFQTNTISRYVYFLIPCNLRNPNLSSKEKSDFLKIALYEFCPQEGAWEIPVQKWSDQSDVLYSHLKIQMLNAFNFENSNF